jgi:DNA-binding NtrC family response regulator
MSSHTQKRLLIIDDDRLFCDVTSEYLQGRPLVVSIAHTGEQGIQVCSRKRIDLVLLDQRLPDMEGARLCPQILMHNERTKIIFITAYPSFDNALKAIQAGAYDYLSKPFEMEALGLAVDQALHTQDLERIEQVHRYKIGLERRDAVLVGKSPQLAQVRRMIELASSSPAPVLIRGETGTGKGLVAKALHALSDRRDGPFIGINCAALPESLIEAELFGYEKGAFTGAAAAKKGIFEMAESGFLFLDEIGDLPLALQAKLLGVLDDKTIKRIGENAFRPVDVRIIAATNIDLDRAIAEKRFRQDLYFRLSVMEVKVPPLREHSEDIPELCRHFLEKLAPEGQIRLPEAENAELMRYSWPGNIRELKNVLERAFILRTQAGICPSKLINIKPSSDHSPAPAQHNDNEPIITLKEMEQHWIGYALQRLSGNCTQAAKALGISRSTLQRKIIEYDLKFCLSQAPPSNSAQGPGIVGRKADRLKMNH